MTITVQSAVKNLRHNFIVNILDGGFFGFAIGFASFTTVIPLFVSSMTDSAVLIGLIPAIHSMGWQLPQLFTARYVSRLKRFKPTVVFLTLQERIPFLGLAAVAWFSASLGNTTALILTFFFLVWQGLGGGVTANAWQMMVARIIPSEYRATFYGAQSSAANLLASVGAIAAGFMLQKLPSPLDFTLLFLIAVVWMGFSLFFIAQTREEARDEAVSTEHILPLWHGVRHILARDRVLVWFAVSRMLSQFSQMAFAFYVIYAVRHHGMSESGAGILTSVSFITQVISNPILGWIADRTNRKVVLEAGAVSALLSAGLAFVSNSVGLFFPVIILAGIASTSFWTIGLAMTSEFGTEQERPTYIGLVNTLIAPFTILAPIIGGFLADKAGYPVTFITSAAVGVVTILVLHFLVTEPRKQVVETAANIA